MATKKLTPVKFEEEEKSKYQALESELLAIRTSLYKLAGHSQNMDYNLWVMMNMIKQIGLANGYTFTGVKDDETETTEKDNDA